MKYMSHAGRRRRTALSPLHRAGPLSLKLVVFPSSLHRLLSENRNPARREHLQNGRIEPVFNGQAARFESSQSVILQAGKRLLSDNRTVIDFFVNKVNGDA